MRSLLIAIVFVGGAAACLPSRWACGQETIMIVEDAPTVGGTPAGSCGCQNVQRPAWHGNVQGSCNPCCDPHTGVFHANPCGQLHMRQQARENCMRMPSHFPRLHTWCRDGYLPSPAPPNPPRCHQCGAAIEAGF